MSENKLDVVGLQHRLDRLRQHRNALIQLHDNIDYDIGYFEDIIDDFTLSPEEKEERRKNSLIPNEVREQFLKDCKEAINLSRWMGPIADDKNEHEKD